MNGHQRTIVLLAVGYLVFKVALLAIVAFSVVMS